VNDLSRLGRNTADLAGIVKTLADRHVHCGH
jgi:DNA invertase Pin-like site-specific DNA recombinase